MTMKDCIGRAHDQGALTKQDAEFLKKKFDEYIGQGMTNAEAQSSVIAFLQGVAKEKERRALLTEDVRKKIEDRIFSHKNRRGEQDIAGGFRTALEDLEWNQKALLGLWMQDLDGFVQAFEKGAITGDRRRQGKWVGNKGVQIQLENVVKELFGENSGDAQAKAYAAAVSATMEKARQQFNAVGGNVGKLDKWGLPQSHNAEALLAVGRTKWVDEITPMLDRERMLHPLTGKKMTDAELKESLQFIWDQITTSGWFDREVTQAPVGKGALYKQHADHRFLHFKDAETWLKYARDYGNPDPYNAIFGHLEIMARDVAAMQMLGPNPEIMRTYLRNLIRKRIETTRSTNIVHGEQAAELDTLYKTAFANEELTGRALDQVKVYQEKIAWLNERIDKLRSNGGSYDGTGTTSNEMRAAITDLQETWRKLKDRDTPTGGLQPLGNPIDTPMRVAAKERMQEILDEWREEIFTPSGNWRGKAARALSEADEIWEYYRGTHNMPHDARLANGFRAARNILVAAKLGSAMVSAISDIGFNKATRAFVGMDRRGIGSIVSGIIENMKGASQAEAMRAGFVLDSALFTLRQQARYAGSLNAMTATGFLADRTVALTGLNAWTQAQKLAFGLDFQGMMADATQKAWAEMPSEIRATLERNLLTEKDWNQLRTVTQHKPAEGAAGILRPREIASEVSEDLAQKYLTMILKERVYAVIEPTLRSRVMMTWGTRAGTLTGEFTRSAMQFKSFGATVALLHAGRIFDEIGAGRWGSAAAYGVNLAVTATIMGAVLVQLKELIGGRDPRPMNSPAFWGAAFLQSGGLGIYGDFLQASENRFGGGLTSTLAGPMAGEIDRLAKLTLGNIAQVARGEKSNFGKELVNALGREIPLLPSAWYGKLAYERMFLDQLQIMLDPEAHTAFRRRMSQRRKDYGNEFFWQPGESRPSRGPNLSSAFGGK